MQMQMNCCPNLLNGLGEDDKDLAKAVKNVSTENNVTQRNGDDEKRVEETSESVPTRKSDEKSTVVIP